MGKINPSLYKKNPDNSSSSSFYISSFGNLYLSYCRIGTESDQSKIRIIRIKNVPDQFCRAGLFVRLQSVYNNSPTFQSSTQFNDVFVFKVRYQKVIRSSRIVILFYRHLLVKSDIQPRVFANFVQKFCCPTKCEGT